MNKFIIIEDDIYSRTLLQKRLKNDFPQANIIVIRSLNDFNYDDYYDYVFLDIMMYSKNSIPFALKLNQIHPSTSIILISANEGYIFDSQEVNYMCFIRKAHFEHDYHIFLRLLQRKVDLETNIQIPSGKKVISVNPHNIVYVDSIGHRAYVHTLKGDIDLIITLQELIDILKEYPFFVRIQRSYIINLNFLNHHTNKKVELKYKDQIKTIPIGGRYLDHFKEYYERYKEL